MEQGPSIPGDPGDIPSANEQDVRPNARGPWAAEQSAAEDMRSAATEDLQTRSLGALGSYLKAADAGTAPTGTSDSAAGPRAEERFGAEAMGTTVGHYELIRPLGRGGMGHVVLARDTRLGRLVALKFLTEHSGHRARRFLIEARATAQFSHENVVVIHDVGEHDGHPYMVLEYLKGQTLKQWQVERQSKHQASAPLGYEPGLPSHAGQPLALATGISPRRAVELIIPVVRALVRAHELGIVHRDLKPSNIMLTDDGTIKVLDFGIAKRIEPGEPSKQAGSDEPAGGREALPVPLYAEQAALTASGSLAGTLMYMSPEQWRRGPVDHRTDIWAIGIILYELLFGAHPLEPVSRAKLESVADLDMPMPSVREACPALGKLGSIIDRCLLKRPADRVESARELLAELEALTHAGRARTDDDRNPYAGLSAFQESDADSFFGRARLVQQVQSRIEEQPLIAIVGPSGAGKSSFVRAGLIPALKRGGDAWEALVIRPGPHPLTALAEVLLSLSWYTSTGHRWASSSGDSTGEPQESAADRDMQCARLRSEPGYAGAQMRARARRKRVRILLFVDQFEELYTLAANDEREAFFACLAGIADDVGSPLRVVISMRSDFLGRMAETHAAAIEVSRGIVLLTPMDREGLREALIRPLEALDYRVESTALVEEMLATLEHTTGALPLLQFTADKLWEMRDRERRMLTEASFRALGGIAGALASHADAVLGAMSAREQKLARSVLLRLVTPERTRALATMGELRELCAAPHQIDQVIARLIEARLLVVEAGGDEESVVEIVHESLVDTWPTLAQWLSDNEEDAVFLARLRSAAREWQKSGQPEGLLWRGQSAAEAKRWQERYQGDLPAAETSYLQAVFALAEGAARRRRRFMSSAFVVLGMVAAVMAYFAWQESKASQAAERAMAQAEAEARRARNATRVARASEYREDPTSQLALLREIEGVEPPPGWEERARQALAGEVARAVLHGHAAAIHAARFSPDGQRIVTASGDHTVRVWSADGRRAPVVLRGHTDVVTSAVLSPDSRRITSVSLDQTVRVWNADGSGTPLILSGHPFTTAQISPDGQRVLTAAADATVRVYSVDGKSEPLMLRGHTDMVTLGEFSPDGRRVVTASADKTVRVWSADGTGEPVVLRGHAEVVTSAQFSPDGRQVVTASADKTVRVWSADGTGEPVVLRGHAEVVTSAQFSPDGRQVVTASADKTVRVWSADGKGEPLVLRGHSDMVYGACFSPDGRSIASWSLDKTARLWNADGKGEPLVLRGHTEMVSAASFSRDSRQLVTVSGDRTARVWSADGGGEFRILRGHSAKIHAVSFRPDGQRIATASADKTVLIWNTDDLSTDLVLAGHEGEVTAVAFSPDGRQVVTGSADGTARVWNADGRGEPLVLRGHTEAVYSAGFSPDGRRVVTASADGTARVWNADGRGESLVLRGHTDAVYSARFSLDGRRVVTASADRTVRIWNTGGSGELLVFELQGHSDAVHSVEFSPDGRRLVTASADRTVRIWSADGRGELAILVGHTGAVKSARFSPSGRHIVSASLDQTVRVWNASSSEELRVFFTHADTIASASYGGPEGRLIGMIWADRTVRVWRDLDELQQGDPRLWTATTYCMPAELRRELLDVSERMAQADEERCQKAVEEALATGP